MFPRVNPRPPARQSERGIALLIVVSMLTVVGILGVAFAFSMYLETQATRQFASTVQSRYLAESGVQHARALLGEDRLGSRIDELSEKWATAPAGSDADVDGDGKLDARWWPLTDAANRAVGHYAMKISDEAGKANLNAAQADPSSLGPGAINLTTLLQQAGVANAHAAAQAIEQYRYGPDHRPGVALVDDNGDGAVDEVDEYQPLALRGDDRRIERLEELQAIAGLNRDQIKRLSRLATVYSWDLNASVSGQSRVNVNTATADELLAVLLEVGVADPWQAAVNMADYVDRDVAMSRVIKSSQLLVVPNQGPKGTWQWHDAPEGHYESTAPGDDALEWTVSVPTGTFRLLAHGIDGGKVGDVTVAGTLKSSVNDGESLGTVDLSGTLTIRVVNHESTGTRCALRGVELVSDTPTGTGVVIRGIEAVRFNELMVNPVLELPVTSAVFDAQSSDWKCPTGSAACTNSGVGQGRWVWTSSTLAPGRYYVRVYGAASGQTVGEVRVEGTSQLLVHGQRHPSTALVASDRKITLTIGKTAADQTYYLQKISVSRQPDGEYVELINLSDKEIAVSGWTIDGEAAAGRQAKFPARSVIKPHGFLVGAVDLDDTQTGLSGNGMAARTMWEMGATVNAVQLEFPGGVPSPDDDWLKVTIPGGNARLVLRSGEATVDEIEYPLPLPTTAAFQSLEKGDPSVIKDKDQDGLDEGWCPSLQLYTPGAPNDNDGLKELGGTQPITHDPTKEVTIRNAPLDGIGELAGLPSGKAWKPFATADLAKIIDRLTVEGVRLETAGHLAPGSGGWSEVAEGYVCSSASAVGTWTWTGLVDGQYRLSLYGWSGEQMAVRWRLKGGKTTDWSPALATDAQGRIVVGAITIGADQTPAGTLTVEVQCQSPSGVCHLDSVRLDPQLIRVGPINVNTAPQEVLMALPWMTDALAQRIIAGRPYGDKDKKSRGIGDLLVGDILGSTEEDRLQVVRHLAHLLTTHSDVFEIESFGQAMEKNHPTASQHLQAVIQR